MIGTRSARRAGRALARSSATTGSDTPRQPPIPRVAFSIAEAAAMLGKNAVALRRECERKARRDGDRLVADLALGIRAHKHDGRWFVTVPRDLLA